MIPEGLKDQIELIVERWRDNDMNDEDLVNVLCRFVAYDRSQKHAKTVEEVERRRQNERLQRERLRADPVRHERALVRERERARLRRSKDLEKHRAKDRRSKDLFKERNPELCRERARRRSAELRAERSPKWVARTRRRGLRLLKEKNRTLKTEAVREAAKKAVPAAYPAHVKDDIVAAVVLVFLDGRIILDEVKAEVKRQTTAYNRMFDTFKNRSLDAIVPGTDSLRLIDKISNDHQRF